MSAKGDARPERQSSWPSTNLGGGLPWLQRYARLAFGAFVLFHTSCQAYRAATDDALPEPGLEAQPWSMALLVLTVWLPFAFLAARELAAVRQPAPAPSTQQRALALLEPSALCLVLVFALLHGAQLAWPVLSGAQLAADVRPSLTAALSGTRSGLPLQAIAALGGVGAACFYAVRQAQRALPGAARAVSVLGVLGYVLGSYAVIRVASGTLLP